MMMLRYPTILTAAQGDPGLLGSIGKALGGVARAAVNILPGPVGAVARTVLSAAGGGSSARPAALPGGMPVMTFAGQTPVPGVRGTVQRLLPGGATGYRTSRRMNVGNAKAARRAIRRIKGVRKMLQSIESQMPKRKCTKPHKVTRR